MRKRIIGGPRPSAREEGQWLALESLAEVEVTSEAPGYPIEAALLPGQGTGWRAAQPGEQLIRLLFERPQDVRRVRLVFEEAERERTQEFALRCSSDGGKTYLEVVRQQYTFSPHGSTREAEDYRVDLPAITILELIIKADMGRDKVPASLAEWMIAA